MLQCLLSEQPHPRSVKAFATVFSQGVSNHQVPCGHANECDRWLRKLCAVRRSHQISPLTPPPRHPKGVATPTSHAPPVGPVMTQGGASSHRPQPGTARLLRLDRHFHRLRNRKIHQQRQFHRYRHVYRHCCFDEI